jgi:hypothetical protein
MSVKKQSNAKSCFLVLEFYVVFGLLEGIKTGWVYPALKMSGRFYSFSTLFIFPNLVLPKVEIEETSS